jgi:hypothetical protein
VPRPAQQRFREGLQSFGRRAVHYHTRPPRYAIITKLKPLTCDLEDSPQDLTEDELNLGHTVRQYDATYGLEVNDTLVVHEMSDGTFVAYEVLHDNPVNP